jgi:hypothetical protein
MAEPGKPDDGGRIAEVEWTDCPTCEAPAGSACRTAGGDTAFRYHTARFILVPALQGQAEVLVPADQGPGEPWQSPESGGAGRLGYAAIGADPPEVREQIEALRAAGCARIFVDQTDPLAVARPELIRALSVAGEAARNAPDGAVIVTVHELRRLARTSRELITLAAGVRRDGEGPAITRRGARTARAGRAGRARPARG